MADHDATGQAVGAGNSTAPDAAAPSRRGGRRVQARGYGRRRCERDRGCRGRCARKLLLPLPEQGARPPRTGEARGGSSRRRVRQVPRQHAPPDRCVDRGRTPGDGPGAAARPAALQRITCAALLTVAPHRGRLDGPSCDRVAGSRDRACPRRRCGTSGGGCVLQRDVLLARHLRSAHDNRPCRGPRRDAAQARRIGRPGSGNPLVGQRKVSSWVISGRFFATSPRGAAPS